MNAAARTTGRMSLFARSLWLIVALIVASQFANFLVFRELVQRPRLERLADYVRANAAAIDLALRRLPQTERAGYLDALNHGDTGWRIVAVGDMPPGFGEAHGLAIDLLLHPLAKALGPGFRLRWQRGRDAHLWVATRLGDRDYWMGFTTGGLLPNMRMLLLLSTAISVALALLGAWAIHRTIHRPLRQLAEAARLVGAGRAPMQLPRDAPPEIANVAHSFAAMAESLAQAEQDRAVMLAGISHDLRTPLAKLRLCVEMLPPDADAELVATMKRSIASSDAIVGQFIDFARVGTEETPERLDLAVLARQVATDVLQPGQLHLDTPDNCDIRGRPVALRRAIMNLVDNAAKYAGGRVDVRLRRLNDAVELAVLDRGPGIAAAQRDELIRPFIRGDVSVSSGLGLAIVDRIARLHGGRLLLRDRDGGGLNATLRLPLTDRDQGGGQFADPAG